MRLKRLDLKACGPFTGRAIEFTTADPGFHIVFGLNEAGKSSALRALKALLYGFPQQTPDNFLHSYDQLLVGGCLENRDGSEIVFQRRKKRIGDVIDTEGNSLAAEALAPFLHGVESEIFESLYGIDHETLVQGGKDILAQKGALGQALFAAGAGISSLREVIAQLEKEAEDLFKPTGQNPDINKALKNFRQLQKDVKAASLSARKWKEHRKVLKKSEAERGRLEKERDDTHHELNRLDRLARAAPELAALESRRNQQQALEAVVVLPPDFNERYQRVNQEMDTARRQLQRDQKRLEKIEAERQTISFNRELLNQEAQVDDFHQRLGEYRKGQKDRPERNGMRISLRKEAARLLKQVRPDLPLEKVETLRPVLAQKRTVQALSTKYEAINQQLAQARRQRKVAEQELEKAEKALAALPRAKASQGLLQAVKMAQQAGDIDTHLEENRSEIDLSKKECQVELKRIGLWEGDLEALMELSLPLPVSVQAFEKQYDEIGDDRREIQKNRKNYEQELKKILADIKKLTYGGQVPSEAELMAIRGKRDLGWKLLRRQWLDQADVAQESADYDPKRPLHEAYEDQVEQADQIADRLRREADRVAWAAALQAQAETLRESLAENAPAETAIELRTKASDEAWAGLWQSAGIIPLSPKEMLGWLAEMDKLRFKVMEIKKKEKENQRTWQRREDLRQQVVKELHAMEEKAVVSAEALGPILALAETVLERIAGHKAELERLTERREKAVQALHQAGEDLKTAQEALAEWQQQWQKALLGLGVKKDISPLEAVDHMETLQSCFDQLKAADDLKKRIDGIDRDAAGLEKEVKAFLEKISPGLLALPLEQAILQLRSMLGQAQKDSTRHDELSREIDTLQEEIALAGKTLDGAEAQMAELLSIAGCAKPQDLPTVISRSMEFQRLQEKISDTEASLAKIGAGVPIEVLAKEAANINVDELPGQIASLQRDIEERINPEINAISQVIGEESGKLAAMDGSAKAAEIAEKMEQELARIRRLADRYALVKLASKILQQEIERYREEHQAPVLKIASDYFNRLTVGSFDSLRTDVDDKSETVLVGVRPDGLRLTVDKMSSGTRDQLYLALRLATLESRLETSEPMPFIVDDILINFDDERSKATLTVLAGLANKIQVILFTHHRQIVAAADGIKGGGTIQIHELPV